MSKESGGRSDLKVRVKTGKGRTVAQKRWLERQLNDPYVARAKREGFRSRAAYKLIEIDDKHRILKPGAKVIDLGAAPGGWSQVSAKRTGESGRVVAIDLLAMDAIPGVEFAQLDFLDRDAPEKIKAMLGGPADVVLSDMAANTTGHRKTDQLRIIGLVEEAAGFAREVLAPGGAFLAKVRQGGTDADLLAMLKRDFTGVKHVKPAASRQDSSELFVIATGFRGQS
ncbi:MAG TPA: RlmE family RNA methyltransferase [Xanthobacteraceae bacterium]|nr:RlmE family RNA methyltransferase [Xanthobacteraceae bacterium]